MYQVTAKAGAIVYPMGEACTLEGAGVVMEEAAERVRKLLERKPKHPGMRVRIEDSNGRLVKTKMVSRPGVDRAEPISCYPVDVEGIPALAEVIHYEPGEPARVDCHPDRADPGSPEIIDYVMRDRKGYRAEWLDDRGEDADVEAQIRENIRKEKESY